jgi:hypothetical protein
MAPVMSSPTPPPSSSPPTAAAVFLPAAFLPGPVPAPCPELLTEREAIVYLRLDEVDVKHPDATLRRYRELGLLRGTQVGKAIRYRRVELEKFLDRITDENPR